MKPACVRSAIRRVPLVFLMTVVSCLVGAQSRGIPESVSAEEPADLKNPFEGDPAAIERGLEVYNERCSFCHGTRGHGAKGPCLTCGHFLYRGGSNAQLFATISGGIPGGQMGAFASSFSSEDIWKIIAFLREETKKRNAEAGRETGAAPSASSTSSAPARAAPGYIPPIPGGADND
jgi:mono/diheme cytochrome c family protein